MTFDELFASLPSDGWLKEEEAKLLLKAASLTEGPILEVGCYHGRSTIVLASLGRSVISVDPFEGFSTTDRTGQHAYTSFVKNIVDRKLFNVTLAKKRIEDYKFENKIDFAYLDGDHTEKGTTSQIKIALKAGAVDLCIHDYDDKGGGVQVKKAVNKANLNIIERVENLVHCRSK